MRVNHLFKYAKALGESWEEQRTDRHLKAPLQRALEKTSGLSLQRKINALEPSTFYFAGRGQLGTPCVGQSSGNPSTHFPPSQVRPLAVASTRIPTTSPGIPTNGQCVFTMPVPPCPVWPSPEFQPYGLPMLGFIPPISCHIWCRHGSTHRRASPIFPYHVFRLRWLQLHRLVKQQTLFLCQLNPSRLHPRILFQFQQPTLPRRPHPSRLSLRHL